MMLAMVSFMGSSHYQIPVARSTGFPGRPSMHSGAEVASYDAVFLCEERAPAPFEFHRGHNRLSQIEEDLKMAMFRAPKRLIKLQKLGIARVPGENLEALAGTRLDEARYH